MSVHLVQLDILHAPHAAMPAEVQRHAVHELVYVARGRYRVEIERRSEEGGAGTAFCYAPGAAHRSAFISRGARERSEAILLQWQEDDAPEYPLRVDDEDRRLFAALTWMLDLHRSEQPRDRAALTHLLTAFLHELARSGGHGRFLVQSVRTYIEDNLARRIRVDDVAAAVGLSKFHLMREFRRVAGEPLMAFTVRVRLERARRLMADPRLRLADIAREVGLSSAFHLSHRFKRAYGQPPRSYRAGLR